MDNPRLGWSLHGVPSWMPVIPHVPSSLLQYAYRGVTAFIAILILIGIAPRTLSGKGVVNVFVSGVGIISLGMYAGHLALINHINNAILFINPEMNTSTKVIVMSIVTLAVSLFLIKALEKNKFIAKVFLGKI